MWPCPVEDLDVAQTAVDILLVAVVPAGLPVVGQQICQGSVGNYRCQDWGWRNRIIGDAEKWRLVLMVHCIGAVTAREAINWTEAGPGYGSGH